MALGSLDEHPLWLTIDEAAGQLRIGRSRTTSLATTSRPTDHSDCG